MRQPRIPEDKRPTKIQESVIYFLNKHRESLFVFENNKREELRRQASFEVEIVDIDILIK